MELSSRNLRALTAYYEVRAVGASPEQQADPVFRRVMALIHQEITAYEARKSQEAALMAAMKWKR